MADYKQITFLSG